MSVYGPRVIAADSSTSAAGTAESNGLSFDVLEFRVLGNSVLPIRIVEQAVYPYLGNHKTLKDVQQARDALARAYRNAGFGTVVVDIPEQSVDSGIVRLRVTEGRLERVTIGGAQYFSEQQLLSELPGLQVGTVPSLPTLQTQLGQIAAESPDRKVTPVLKPGSEPGTVDVELKVSDHLPLHASIELDNDNTVDTTALRATGIVSYTNMFQRAETLSFQYETSPEAFHEVQLQALTYLGRTANPDLSWSVYGIRSRSDVAAVGTLSVIGNGEIAGGRVMRTLHAGANWADSLSLGADYKDFTQDVRLTGGASTTPIHYIVWSGLYGFNTQGARYAANGSLSLNLGIPGVGTTDADFEFNRFWSACEFPVCTRQRRTAISALARLDLSAQVQFPIQRYPAGRQRAVSPRRHELGARLLFRRGAR